MDVLSRLGYTNTFRLAIDGDHCETIRAHRNTAPLFDAKGDASERSPNSRHNAQGHAGADTGSDGLNQLIRFCNGIY